MQDHSDNVAIMRRFDDADGNFDVIHEELAREDCWEFTVGFLFGNIDRRIDNAIGRFFARLSAKFLDRRKQPPEFSNAHNWIFALGPCFAGTKEKDTSFKARFAHLGAIHGRRIIGLQPIAGMVQIPRASETK